MSQIMRERLSDARALEIADTLLEAFGILYNAIPMKFTNSIEGGQQIITRVFCNRNNSEISRVENGTVDYKDSDEYHLDNVYILYWKNRRFKVTLYSSPEECGYYPVLPDYDDLAYTFCIIEETNGSGCTKYYEMCFSFDSEKKTFLELFDIDLHSFNGIIFEAGDSVKSKLKGRIIL